MELPPPRDDLVPSRDGLIPGRDGLRPKRDGLRPDSTDLRPDGTGFRPDRNDLRPESTGFRLERDDLRPIRDRLRPAGADLRPDRPGFRPDRDDLRPIRDRSHFRDTLLEVEVLLGAREYFEEARHLLYVALFYFGVLAALAVPAKGETAVRLPVIVHPVAVLSRLDACTRSARIEHLRDLLECYGAACGHRVC